MPSRVKHEFANTPRFAAEQLVRHWREKHVGRAGNSNRQYECMTCRGLAARMRSSLGAEHWRMRYEEVAIMARAALRPPTNRVRHRNGT